MRRGRRSRRTRGRCSSPRSAALELVPESEFTAAAVQEALSAALIEGLGLKPRVAYGPLRVALSGRRVSPPLFESIELLGKPESIRRLGASWATCARSATLSVWQAHQPGLDLTLGTSFGRGLGVWCNWQHGGFWYLCSWFESRYPSREFCRIPRQNLSSLGRCSPHLGARAHTGPKTLLGARVGGSCLGHSGPATSSGLGVRGEHELRARGRQ